MNPGLRQKAAQTALWEGLPPERNAFGQLQSEVPVNAVYQVAQKPVMYHVSFCSVY